ncbi:aminoglycoside phosphotransferase family protein [Streptomyces thermolilacinus]
MTTFLTPQQRADRTSAAVGAAVAAGRGLGLTVAEPTVLHDVFSVVVHLAPSPVVARVPTVLPRHDDLATIARRQQDELDVTRWLADQGVPVIAPSSLVPREPVQRDGFSMTFWPFIEENRDKEPDYVANAESVAHLHAALRAYPGRLQFLSAADPEFIADSLTRLDRHPDLLGPDELDRARREWKVLEPLTRSRSAFEARFPGVELQPLHGDSPPANIFHAMDGDLYADFELVTLGPVEWDLAALGPEHQAAYNRGARRNGTRPLDEGVLAFVNALGMLRVIAALTLVPQLPELMEHLKPAVEHWQTTPFAAGMSG